MNLRMAPVISTFLLLTASAAGASDTPSLVGTWKGKATAVHIGNVPYRDAKVPGANFGEEEIEFSYTITEQKGRNFTGEMRSGGKSETIIGAIQPDNRGGVMLDDDGQYTFAIRAPDTIDTCYYHSNSSSRVVACWTITRVP